MLTSLLPILYTLFLWWFTTGLVFALFNRSRAVMDAGMFMASVLVVVAVGGIMLTRHDASSRSVYVAIACGVVIWMWQTASYFLGYVTGIEPPEKAPDALSDRFRVAFEASVYHELIALLFGVFVWGLVNSAENRWAFYIYVALWLMHASAKLNVFLGVRNFRIDFMPKHLHSLKNLMGSEPMNLLMPFSVLFPSTLGLLFLFHGVSHLTAPGHAVGLMIVGTMILLGVLEHVLLVMPFPAILWGWSTRSLSEQVQE